MIRQLVWKGIAAASVETCTVNTGGTGITVMSVVSGHSAGKDFVVNYQIKMNSRWEAIFIEVYADINGLERTVTLTSDGNGSWYREGEFLQQFNGCAVIDISVTAFTNTLAIKRLQLAEMESAAISVLYIDVMDGLERPVTQKYSRLAGRQYRYENVPNDFEAIITVDELGLVIDYPGLFKRIDEQ